jgi:RimJ/RimL family protein N-acetyltransferase
MKITPLVQRDIAEMYLEVKRNQGFLKELAWLATTHYGKFLNHYNALITSDKIQIFVIRWNGQVAGAVEVEVKDDGYFIGYWLGRKYRGHGIATDAVKQILESSSYANRPIISRADVKNKKSQAVLERCGFVEDREEDNWIYYTYINVPFLNS